jgi:SAM-dependent methyltransferase
VVCDNGDIASLVRIERAPIFCSRLCESRETALQMPCGPIELGFCGECGHIFNLEFDAGMLEYGPGYENSQHCSGSFQAYAGMLAQTLVDRYSLRGRRVLEVGCGRGEFLALLCEKGNNRGVGFDPSYCGDDGNDRDEAVSIKREKYDSHSKGLAVDFVCCRHTLEHIANPRAFLAEIREAIGRPDVPVFFEVPNAFHSLSEGMWDIIYEHCSYYSLCSLGRLFGEEGFAVCELTECFDGQFAAVHATTGKSPKPFLTAARDDLKRLADAFPEFYRRRISDWEGRLQAYDRAGKRVTMWGAGAKGTTFLNTLRPRAIDYVVDVNPRKHGKYIAGTGQLIVGPAFLKGHPPDVVIYQNSYYRDEIAAQIRSFGLTPELVLA